MTDYANSSTNNLVLESLHHINRHSIDNNSNPIAVTNNNNNNNSNNNNYTSSSSSPSTLSVNTTTTSDVSTASAVVNKSVTSHCNSNGSIGIGIGGSVGGGSGGGSGNGNNANNTSSVSSNLDKKKCMDLQPTSSNNNSSNNNNNNNNNNNHNSAADQNLLDASVCSSHELHHIHGNIQKSHCCMTTPLTAISSTVSTTAVAALPPADLARDQWYVHHAHHTPTHPHHQQLPEEFVMYAPALPTSSSTSSLGKFGIESSTESYLNSRYNVNVKGVRHERTSSFFDIPAVTHPYCYRFPPSPPAGILKKSDDDPTFCNNSASSSLQFGQHFHNSKTEHPDSTTTHLTNHHTTHHNAHHHHHHHHPHTHSQTLHHTHHHQHAHLSPHHSSAFKFSHSTVLGSTSPSIYHQYNGQSTTAAYGLRSSAELAPSLTLAPASTTTDGDIKYESHYNAAISSTYTLRPVNGGVDSSTAVSSTDTDFKLDSLYASNNSITTSHTVSQRRGSLQLWQFLVALLDEPTTNCIAWTGRGMEFKLIEPEEVARRWGIQKNRPAMNYDKLSRSLRYYYEKGIMQKVNGERYVYRFVCDPEALFNMAYGHLGASASNSATTTTTTTAKADQLNHHHHQHQHHHHHHHPHQHLLTAVGKSGNLDPGLVVRDSVGNSSLDEESQRERSALSHVSIPASKHHEQLFYGKF